MSIQGSFLIPYYYTRIFEALTPHFPEKFISFYKNNLGYLNDIKKEAEGKYQYVQWKESDKDVKPIQIAIRKKEKQKSLFVGYK
ncbi:MAG: hypothetical protein J5977_05880 [Fibrobacter sp.]|nr:hypothetical protein [Fibrobacter sp.]